MKTIKGRGCIFSTTTNRLIFLNFLPRGDNIANVETAGYKPFFATRVETRFPLCYNENKSGPFAAPAVSARRRFAK